MRGSIKKEYQNKAIHRLKIIQGQVKGVQKMIEQEEYCMDILNQSSAIRESLKSLDALLLENHLKVHLLKMLKGKSSDKAVKEMLKLYKLNH